MIQRNDILVFVTRGIVYMVRNGVHQVCCIAGMWLKNSLTQRGLGLQYQRASMMYKRVSVRPWALCPTTHKKIRRPSTARLVVHMSVRLDEPRGLFAQALDEVVTRVCRFYTFDFVHGSHSS